MTDNIFRFKQFSIAQGGQVMKVNTDGALLASWAEADQARSILDIGTGTGLIALMLAQKNSEAVIDAIDIQKEAYELASLNFRNSPWSGRVRGYHSSLQDFKPEKKYDFIISNPPYFERHLQAPDAIRNVSRHAVDLRYEELLYGIARLLHDQGSAGIVIPFFAFEEFRRMAEQLGLYVDCKCEVISVTGKAPYIALIQLRKTYCEAQLSKMEIHSANGVYSPEFVNLMKDFYLKM